MEDPDKQATYAAEDMVATWIDAAVAGDGEVTVSTGDAGGVVTFAPEVEPRFTGPAEATDFVHQVMGRLQRLAKDQGVSFRGREHKELTVSAHTGWKKASYRQGTIYLPTRERGGAWALRALVVLHEVAHHLNTGVEGAIIDQHGEGFRATFARLLECLGWDQQAAMLREAFRQHGLRRDADVDDGMLARVGKLLRHAEGAGSGAERETFFAKAQELATLHSIELAVARAAQEKQEGRAKPTFEFVQLGHRGQQSNVRFVELMLAIAGTNDLRCTIRTDNTGMTLYGFRGDIEVVKTLYVTLVVQMVSDADAYIRSGAHRPVHGRTARAAFYQGWTSTIGDRLRQARRAARDSVARAAVVGVDGLHVAGARAEEVRSGRDVALKAKAVEVSDYYAHMLKRNGVRGNWRGSGVVEDFHSMRRGNDAAERARLRREKQLEGSEGR